MCTYFMWPRREVSKAKRAAAGRDSIYRTSRVFGFALIDPWRARPDNIGMAETTNPSESPPVGDAPNVPIDAASKATQPARRPRRWYQFTLRAVLVLILLVGVLLAGWRMYLAPYQAQADAIERIQRFGGTYQADGAAAWMNRLAGFELRNVKLMNLADCDRPDEYLDDIRRLPHLECLIVGGAAFSDDRLGQLEPLTSLRVLVLDSTTVSEDAIAAIREALPELQVYRSDRRIMQA